MFTINKLIEKTKEYVGHELTLFDSDEDIAKGKAFDEGAYYIVHKINALKKTKRREFDILDVEIERAAQERYPDNEARRDDFKAGAVYVRKEAKS